MGATGTGKSALSLELAQRIPTVIINADAMQMVRELRIITARPMDAEMAAAEHALYGVLPAAEPTSVARWLELVRPVIEQAWKQGKTPLIVGGTGMYIKALIEGLAEVPEIPESVRASLRAKTTAELYAALQEADPAMAARLKPGDTQRIARALEVVEATGTSLAEWQGRAATPLFPGARYHCFAVTVPRETLYARLNVRFVQMLEQGALEEIIALKKLNLPADTPILRAHGVPELMAHLDGRMTLEEAVAKAQQHTRNYAKRQETWLRNQLAAAPVTQVSDIINIIGMAASWVYPARPPKLTSDLPF